MTKPNPECVECIGQERAEFNLTAFHDACTDEICYACGKWDDLEYRILDTPDTPCSDAY